MQETEKTRAAENELRKAGWRSFVDWEKESSRGKVNCVYCIRFVLVECRLDGF